MNNLTLLDSEPRKSYKPEPPSYFEYHARRTLPGDKTMEEYRKTLNRWYLAADVEHILRGMIRRGVIQNAVDQRLSRYIANDHAERCL